MKNTVDQPMWEYQQHFRRAAESKTEAALPTIGLPVGIPRFLSERVTAMFRFPYAGSVSGGVVARF